MKSPYSLRISFPRCSRCSRITPSRSARTLHINCQIECSIRVRNYRLCELGRSRQKTVTRSEICHRSKRIQGPTGSGRRLAILATIPTYILGKSIAVRGCTLSLIPNVAKAVKTASVTRPNQNHESCDALGRTAAVCISSLSVFSHSRNPAVGVSFFWLP